MFLSVFEKIFKEISSHSLLLIISVAGEISTYYNRILAYNFNIFPADFYILVSAHKSEAFASAPYYHRHKTATAGVNFNIADTTEPTTRLGAYDLFIPQVRNTAIHFITPFYYIAQAELIMNYKSGMMNCLTA